MNCGACNPEKKPFWVIFSRKYERRNNSLCESCVNELKYKCLPAAFLNGGGSSGIFAFPLIIALFGEYSFLVISLLVFALGYYSLKFIVARVSPVVFYESLSDRKSKRLPIEILGFFLGLLFSFLSIWVGLNGAEYI